MRPMHSDFSQFGKPRSGGFTLVEAIIVIALTGVIAAVVAVFITKPVQGYIDASRRAELADVADTALRRMGRDLHLALPNSVRSANSNCIEFIPTTTGGRYRAQCSTQPCPAGEEPLDFTSADTAFDVLGGLNTTPAQGDYIVINNMGSAPADAYATGNTVRATVGATPSTARITLSPAFQFGFESPTNHFFVVPGAEQAVSYVCSNPGLDAAGNGTGILYRASGYGFVAAPSGCQAVTPGTTPVLAKNVSQCSFSYSPGVLQRSAIVSMRIGLTLSNETVSLFHQVHVSNVP